MPTRRCRRADRDGADVDLRQAPASFLGALSVCPEARPAGGAATHKTPAARAARYLPAGAGPRVASCRGARLCPPPGLVSWAWRRATSGRLMPDSWNDAAADLRRMLARKGVREGDYPLLYGLVLGVIILFLVASPVVAYPFGPITIRNVPLGGASNFLGCNPNVAVVQPRSTKFSPIASRSPIRGVSCARDNPEIANAKEASSVGVSARTVTHITLVGGAPGIAGGFSMHLPKSSADLESGSDAIQFAESKPLRICRASAYASGSFLRKNNSTGSLFLPISAAINLVSLMCLGPSRSISSSASFNLARASDACAVASPAVFAASASRLFDRVRNSVWIRASNLPKITSPTIPSATTASATVTPQWFQNESYAGWIYAIANSAIIPITTNPAQPHSHRPQDDDALSNWASLAFILPFGKNHAGKEFSGFWIGLGIGALIFAFLYVISVFVG